MKYKETNLYETPLCLLFSTDTELVFCDPSTGESYNQNDDDYDDGEGWE